MNEAGSVLSTYRLQLHAGFTFDDARAVLEYLRDLGVSHAYLSPITAATPGSTHGYDVIEPMRLNPELGGEEGYTRLVEEQRRLGLGQVVDIVPNHMGIAPGNGNAYWLDVLRRGRQSEYAAMFDVDWEAPPEDRVILPILGASLDEVIAAGDVTLDRGEGDRSGERREPALVVYGHRLPLRAGSLDEWDETSGLRPLVLRQHYRLEYWRDGEERLDYRRFFAIDDLIGIRTEVPEVFELTHRLPLDLVARGAIDGLRVDHLDGLRDPRAYLATLRDRMRAARGDEGYLIVEKILEADEPLPGWDCDGTTGYDVLNEFTRVLLRTDALERFDAIERGVTGRTDDFDAIALEGRTHVVRVLLGGQFSRLARRLYAALTPEGVTPGEFVDALLTLLAHVEPYRTYHRTDALDPLAPTIIGRAMRLLDASPAIEAARDALAAPPEGAARECVLSIQQAMPAVQAKGVEDRALYRFRRLMALNEVGGDPSLFGESVATFHERMGAAARARPRRMLATATHDHKLGEDVRARLLALAEVPDEWERAVEAALPALRRLQPPGGPEVHPADLYLLLQILVGASPDGMTQGRAGDDELEQRFGDYLVKALREAAERTDWVDGDEAYESAVAELARNALADAEVQSTLQPVLDLVAPAGAVDGLAQLILKLAGPGVPDTYQGNELWDVSLVDPDNRRAVDFDLRRQLLHGLRDALVEDARPEARAETARRVLDSWRDGDIKTYVLARALHERRARPGLFVGGAYDPVTVAGERARHALAFARRDEDAAALVVIPRFPASLHDHGVEGGRLWAPSWGDTSLEVPSTLTGSGWRNAFTGTRTDGGTLRLDEVLGAFPVALLLREER